MFSLIADTARALEENKKGHLVKNDLNSRWVALTDSDSNYFIEDLNRLLSVDLL